MKGNNEGKFELWFLQFHNSELAKLVIEKVFDEDVYTHQNLDGSKKIICKIIIEKSESRPPLTLRLETRDVLNIWDNRLYSSAVNLIGDITYENCGEKIVVYINIKKEFISLVERVTKESLIRAIDQKMKNFVRPGRLYGLEQVSEKYYDSKPRLSIKEADALNYRTSVF